MCTKLAGFDDAFPSSVPFIVEKNGCVLAPICSKEAASNLGESKRASFYARAPREGAASSSVLTLLGRVEEISNSEVSDADLRDVSAASGTSIEELANKPWVRMLPERVHVFDALRGIETWVAQSDYAEAEPNPLAGAAATLLAKLNTQHQAALRRFASVYVGGEELESAEVVSIDQMGFDLRTQGSPSAPPSLLRASFKTPPANAEEGTSVFMKLFQEAYEKDQGFMEA